MRAFSLILPALLLPCAAAPVQVGTLPAKVVPEQVTTLPMEPGLISDLAEDGQHLQRGAVVARLNKERTEQEREEMELKIAREQMSQKDEIRKLEIQRNKVKFYLNLSEGERRYATEMQQEELPPTKETLKDINERMALLKRELEALPRLRHNEFERTHAKNTVKMPFSGRIQFHFKRPAGEEDSFEYLPTPGLPFATICDDSAYYITINLSRAELTQLQPERFTAVIDLPEGRTLTGTYDRRRVEAGGNGDMLVYFFRLAESDHETAHSMLGSHAQVRLLYDAGEDTLSVSKQELVTRPEAAGCDNWEELVTKLYPDYCVVLVAERNIILRRRAE